MAGHVFHHLQKYSLHISFLFKYCILSFNLLRGGMGGGEEGEHGSPDPQNLT